MTHIGYIVTNEKNIDELAQNKGSAWTFFDTTAAVAAASSRSHKIYKVEITEQKMNSIERAKMMLEAKQSTL